MKKYTKRIVLLGLLSLTLFQAASALGSSYAGPPALAPDPNKCYSSYMEVLLKSTPESEYRGGLENYISLTWKFSGGKVYGAPCIVDRFEANVQRYFGMGSAGVIASNSRTSFSWYGALINGNQIGSRADHTITTSVRIESIDVWYRSAFTMFYHDLNGNYYQRSLTTGYIQVDYGIGSGGSVPVLPV